MKDQFLNDARHAAPGAFQLREVGTLEHHINATILPQVAGIA